MTIPSDKLLAWNVPELEGPPMQTQEYSWGRPDLGQPITNFDRGNVDVETTPTAIRLRPHGPLLDAEIAHATIEAASAHTRAHSPVQAVEIELCEGPPVVCIRRKPTPGLAGVPVEHPWPQRRYPSRGKQ